MIELNDVSFTYESGETENSLKHIDLTIHDGETILFCGESGCGKTTLTRLINGLIPHYYTGKLDGKVLLDGGFGVSESANTVLQRRYNQRNCVRVREYGIAGS